MDTKQLIVNGFAFTTKEEYEKAVKESESVEYIKAKSNLKQAKTALKVYMSLVEKNVFETVVGYTFLETLRRFIIHENIVPEDMVPAVPVKHEKGVKTEEKDKQQAKEKQHKPTISYYLNFFLLLIIIAMFYITYNSPKNNLDVATKKVQDEYSSWEQQLQEKEAELEAREEALEK